MDETPGKHNHLINTTDCLEAVGVFRCWKNFLFIILILCLLFLQGIFWLVNLGYFQTSGPDSHPVVMFTEKPADANEQTQADQAAAIDQPNEPAIAVSQPNQPAAQHPKEKPEIGWANKIKFDWVAWTIRFLNFALAFAAILYCLTMLFSLKISLLGRLGGINHIARAFFLSLVLLVLILPWQLVFAPIITGSMFTPAELLRACTEEKSFGIFGTILFYLRFTGFWLLVLLLLVFSHIRSARWAKALLRRLEVI